MNLEGCTVLHFGEVGGERKGEGIELGGRPS